MKNNSFIPRFALLALSAWWVPASLGATFGKVIPIGGHAADIALDERRGVLYIANFAGSRIDVLSTSDHALRAPIRVKAQPNSLALSPAGRYLVVTHFPDPPAAPALPPTGAGVTILDLEAGGRRELVLKNKPLAVAFGNGSKALLVTVKPPPTEGTETTSTTGEFLLLDPETAVIETLQLANLSTGTLPVRFGTFPPEVVRASASVSGDGQSIHVLADGETGFAVVRYSVPDNQLRVVGITASPPLGPRVISADRTGSHVLAGWGLVDERFVLLAQFPRPTGQLNIGSHAFDYSRNLIYAQVPVGAGAQAPASPSAPTTPTTPTTPQTPAAPTPAQPPVLDILDADNLTVRERIQLKENLAGKSLLTRDLRTLYAISDSGITVLPVGDLAATPRVATLQEDVVFRGNACDRTLMRQELGIVDLSGANTDFTLKLPDSARGIRLSAGSGTTPATVTLELDPTAFQSQKGTAVISLEITSRGAINIPRSVRILVNTREVDQRGTFQSIPGKLVDILPDPRRQRLYIIRQDTNEVLVLSAGSLERIARLRTGNTPVQMAITLDGRQLLVSNDNSQMINVYDLDTLQQLPYVEFTSGSYPRSIAVTRGAIWVTGRAVAPPHQLHRIDLQARTTLTPKTLGIFSNEINADAVLTTSPTASTMLMAMPEGIGVLYEADFDAFSVARKDLQPLSGAYLAISDERFIINNTVLNRSLVPERRLDLSGTSSGLAMAGGLG
ncbi:MAG: hypothetical protein HYS04_21610, partial [Acidobacteria bacterium]|nr:hypothetical protein [Acidobacteriota bacterium]